MALLDFITGLRSASSSAEIPRVSDGRRVTAARGHEESEEPWN